MEMINRRRFFSLVGVSAGLLPYAASSIAVAQIKQPGERALAPEAVAWMNAWMGSAQKQVSGQLYLGRFSDPIYFLTQPINWAPDPGQDLSIVPVVVPVGFVTDLASILRAFFSLLRPDGQYVYAAIVHDYLYWTQLGSREAADKVLKYGMQEFNVPPITVSTIYDAVRLAGASSWRDNARLKASGEKRVLKKFPTDPRTTWSQWKMHEDVFQNP